TYVVKNTGNVTLAGPVTVADDKTTVTCPATASLAPGASVTCTASYAITQADLDAGSVTNLAKAKVGTVDSNQATATVNAVPKNPPPPPPPAPSPDLGIVKAGPATAVKPGDDVSYTLTVTNTGRGSASNVGVTDALPDALTLVSATGGNCTGTTTITCALGTLNAGGSVVVTVVTKLAATYTATAVANTAVVGPPDSNPSNNTSTTVTQVTLPTPPPPSDLGLSKVGTGSVAPGGVISWVVTVTNVKGTPAAGFTVTDNLPAGVALLNVGGTDWSCTRQPTSVSCTYTGAPLPVGASSAFAVDGVVGTNYAGTSVANTAVVDPGGVDPSNDTATATTEVVTPIQGDTGGEDNVPTPSPTAGPEITGVTPEQPASRPTLPFTGSYADRALSAGVLLLLVGLLLALVGRRRRTV
ncbi:MAG: hypothetical protein ABR614_04465, partial [Mycobacteriales bacterium]